MPRITPVHYKVLVCIFEKAGFVYDREKSSHIQYVKPGVLRPITIPKYSAVDVNIIRGLLRSAKMNRDEYFRLLEKCR